MKRTILAATAVAAAAMAAQAHAGSVTVIGGGLAETCSKAALSGKSDRRLEDFCTDALDKEMLNSRDRAGTFVNRGVLRLRRADWSGANADFNAAVHAKPDMGEAYVNRGAVAVGQHKYAESLADLNKGLALGVEEPAKAYFNRALAYEGLDDAKSAYFDYQKALELSPDWAAPKAELARFHVERKEDAAH
ncbi:tetratricopeptide repeat protein [Phenylobacterium sp.]|uniref:tetratricopeptide repeat protein n=1 Tax=Phenylobacterium sp. TaxID=1871053 RepID=UPI001206D0CB|nr:tetratricopeptide repeat protein [Phenylobacterium sp.]THD64612.1 MAG: tetratricopeptide repeat protein [Phenylobacterium sp.]